MPTRSSLRVVAVFAASLLACSSSHAQQTLSLHSGGLPSVPSRVVEPVDDSRLVTLTGNTHPLARPRYDRGLADPGKLLERMMLVLERSPEQEAALAAFNARQYDPKSPDFHHWLHAEEFGRLYGPSDSDLAAVLSWLQSHGFLIDNVGKGRVTLEFTGTVAQVQQAFHVEMHRYLVDGKEHLANDRDPRIPQALAPVVAGIASMNDFYHRPQSVFGNYVKRDRSTGKIAVLDSQPGTAPASSPEPKAIDGFSLPKSDRARPQLTYVDSSQLTHEDVTPWDFAAIYNILPLWQQSSPINGKGVKIAISGVSDIQQSDVNTFRSSFNLPAMTLQTIHNGSDPGLDGSGGQIENTLDVEMAGASAPGAQIVLVVSANTATTGGDQLSDSYIIDNETASIMSASYGECELALGTAGNAAYNKIWNQGATEGISIFNSSGDQGSAGCTSSNAGAPNADSIGLEVNGLASSPFNTAVGGTDFTWSFINSPTSKYWNASNSANLATAKGYLPEVPWNSTCANPLLPPIFTSVANTEQLCNDALVSPNFIDLVNITGGSGGASHCTVNSTTATSTFLDPTSCSGGYAKPSWQNSLGVPQDQHRDLPDISFFASGGFPDGLNGSAILFCVASNSPETSCNYSDPNYIVYQEVGGTSASSPFTAGIMALIQQKTGAPQGLANPVLYTLYNNQVKAGTACDSSTSTNSDKCVFHDISQGTISQVCVPGGPNCITANSADQAGLLSGFAAKVGYDQAIGLGSANVANLVNGWAAASGAPTVTLTPTIVVFPSTAVGVTSATVAAISVKNTGTAAAVLDSFKIGGANASSFSVASTGATACGSSLAAGASCSLALSFKPVASGILSATLNVVDNAGTQSVDISGTGALTFTLSLSPATLAFAATKVGQTSAAQPVTVKNTGSGTVALTSETFTGTNASSFVQSASTCGASLAAGASCTVSVEFKPAAAGVLAANLSIADNATGSPQIVSLSGTAVPNTPSVTLTPTSLAFPNTISGTLSDAQVVTVANSGQLPVTLTSILLGGSNATSFTQINNCGATLAAGASCSLYVAFQPTSAAALSASIAVADNATGSPQKITLTGTGTAAPSVKLSTASIAFPTTTHGTASAAQPVTLTNTGSATVNLTSIALTGTNPTDFEALSTCAATLAPAASCTVYVAFKPATAAAFSAKLTVTDNGSASPQTVALTGTGK